MRGEILSRFVYTGFVKKISINCKQTDRRQKMGLIKRLTATVTASFDSIVGQIENHQALVEQAISEMKRSAVQANRELRRVKGDGSKLEEKIKELSESSISWESRAKKIATTDKEKAIECVRRKKSTDRELVHSKKQLIEQKSLENALVRDLAAIENRITELTRKKNALVAKEVTTRTLEKTSAGTVMILSEVDEIIDRWEEKVTIYDNGSEYVDEFESEFKTEEERDELEKDLEELLG